MLKILTYIITALFLFILYGQEMFDMPSVIHSGGHQCSINCEDVWTFRGDFYFVGMAIVMSLFSYFLYKVDKNIATGYLLFMHVGEIFNQIYSAHDLGNIEIACGIIGFVYVLLESKIKKYIKKWLK